MRHNLSSQIEDLFENGLLNILKAIPGNFLEKERLAIESVIYPAYGFYRTYRRLENTLAEHTSDVGLLTRDIGILRDIFSDVWSLVDVAYIISKLGQISPQKDFLTFSDNTAFLLNSAAQMRNFMDHPDKQFNNAINAPGWLPLFGWVSYQFTPCARCPKLPKNVVYFVNLGSTHLRGKFNINTSENIYYTPLGEIDRITLHLKKNDRCDLSLLMANLAADLNLYSTTLLKHLLPIYENPCNQQSGLQVPFPQFTVRAENNTQPISLSDIKTYLEIDKSRIQIELDD